MRARVQPGDALGVAEEYAVGHGVYEDRRGILRSSIVGLAAADPLKKVVSVRPAIKRPLAPKPGDIVEGVVEHVTDDLAFVRIYWVEDRACLKPVEHVGAIHVSQVSNAFTKTMFDVLAPGDVVRAKVLGGTGVYQLSIKEPQLGVVYARCTKCGEPLRYRDGRLVCPACGNVDKRKVSQHYILAG